MTNFNFKKDWEKFCMPIMRTDRIYKAIKKGVKGYVTNSFIEGKPFLKEEPFKKNDYPLRHAQGDSICFVEDEIEERIIPLLKEKGILKDDRNKPLREAYEDEESFFEASDAYLDEEYTKYKNSIIEPYVDVERMKNYKYFCLYGGCHWYNPTFGITLARMVMPDIKWKIIVGNYHTTVVSHDEKLVFDILYFDEEDTETYGGRHAIQEAKKLTGITAYPPG